MSTSGKTAMNEQQLQHTISDALGSTVRLVSGSELGVGALRVLPALRSRGHVAVIDPYNTTAGDDDDGMLMVPLERILTAGDPRWD